MNSRLQQMIDKGTLPLVGGQWIDTYNQTTDPDIAGTIIAGINAKNHYYTMEQQVLNTTADGLATTLTGAHHYAGNIVSPKRGQTEMGVMENYRIRKLTPRECFRLMDVSESDIDKIQAAGISNSQQYKMAGNSIVVSCLYHIFDKLFINKQITTRTLFD